MGYYAVATNLAKPAKDILTVSQKNYQIKDCFSIIKRTLTDARLDDQKTHVTPDNLVAL